MAIQREDGSLLGRYASLMGLLWVMVGVEVLLGLLAAWSAPTPLLFPWAFPLLPALLAGPNYVGARLIRRYYERAYHWQPPKPQTNLALVALGVALGVVAGALLSVAALI